jgi:hypothetical protein
MAPAHQCGNRQEKISQLLSQYLFTYLKKVVLLPYIVEKELEPEPPEPHRNDAVPQ